MVATCGSKSAGAKMMLIATENTRPNWSPSRRMSSSPRGVTALQRVTRAVPIVFVRVADPIGAGVVDSLARPGGNVTGFMNYEYSLSGKWLEVLKQIEPRLTRAEVVRDAANPASIAQFGAIRTTASSLGVDVSPINISDAREIERPSQILLARRMAA